MSNVYSDLTGEYKHPVTGDILYGTAPMLARIHAMGGLRKIQEEAYMDGFRDGGKDGFESGYQVGRAENLKDELRKCVVEILSEMEIHSPKD
ncbi:hypothetical protein ACOCG7_34125 (plasmid) [Paraburkholderia sp. DD10]|uniref:hypothetical protein n=1 Tax=Paraburkholderia sp. DD10 TaxID=3409691 RepID=UPI003BA16808